MAESGAITPERQQIREQAACRCGVAADRGAHRCPIETREHADVLASGKVACSPSSPSVAAPYPPGGSGRVRSAPLRLRAAPRALLPFAARVGARGRGRWGEGATGGVSEARVTRGSAAQSRDVQNAHGCASCGVSHNKEVTSVRASTLLSTILGMKHTRVEAVAFDELGVVADVAPTTSIPRCSGCFCRVDEVYDGRPRYWRHLDLAGMRLVLRYRLRRVDCPRCGVRVELVPWAEPGSWFTRDFEEHTAYLAQTTDKTTVVNMMRVAWRTVGEIARRVVDRFRPGDALDGLRLIGVDELSFLRHHKYITVVIDHVAQRVV